MKIKSIFILCLILLALALPILAQEATPVPVAPIDALAPQLQLAFEPLLLKIIEVCLTAVSVLATYLVTRLVAYLKTKLNHNQLTFLKAIVQQAVLSAEQLGVSKQINDSAEAKKQYATDQVTKRLADAGLFTLANDAKLVSDSIEAAIQEHVNSFGKLLAGSISTLDDPVPST